MESSSSSTSMVQSKYDFEEVRRTIWGITLQDALHASICIHCKKSIVLQMEAPEEIHWHQYEVSGYCPTCFRLSILQPSPPNTQHTRRAK